jgi:hypothetical protein
MEFAILVVACASWGAWYWHTFMRPPRPPAVPVCHCRHIQGAC